MDQPERFQYLRLPLEASQPNMVSSVVEDSLNLDFKIAVICRPF